MTQLDPNWQSDALDLSLDYADQTIAVRGGYHRTDEGEHNEAIFTTSSYVYNNAADAADHFNGNKKAMSTRAIPIRRCALLSADWQL